MESQDFSASQEVHHVLAVDDDPIIRTIIKKLLSEAGLSVEVAVNGADALSVIAASPHPFDLVILDLAMPVMNGHEAVKEIMRTYPGLPIILCSGSVTDLERAEGDSSGAVVGVITKPFSVVDFVQEIVDTLESQPSGELTVPEVMSL